MQHLLQKIHERRARIVVVGVGYVGLPLLIEFVKAGFQATGYDKDEERVGALLAGKSYIGDIRSEEIQPLIASGKLGATTQASIIEEADCVVVCVPTPLNKTKDPDMRFIATASDEIAEHQHENMLIVLESTTYPGTTREVLVPTLTRGRYEAGKDVFIAFSPERVDPGNQHFGTRNTPKVIGGTTPECLAVAQALYGTVIDTLVPVSSTDTAEMVKLLENTFRAVNIGLVNEVALMSRRLGVDVWEVIRAAMTKPFGFMPFFPGPGLGGHCVPLDPLYLSWRMRTLKYQARFIELADTINSAMPEHVVNLVQQALNNSKKPAKGSKVLVVGVAYKRDVSDYRESPAFDIIYSLQNLGACVNYLDPHIPRLDEAGIQMESVPADVCFSDYDAVVIVTDHRDIDYARLLQEAMIVVDTRDALRHVQGDRSKVVKL